MRRIDPYSNHPGTSHPNFARSDQQSLSAQARNSIDAAAEVDQLLKKKHLPHNEKRGFRTRRQDDQLVRLGMPIPDQKRWSVCSVPCIGCCCATILERVCQRVLKTGAARQRVNIAR
jgi:hypothetical protein